MGCTYYNAHLPVRKQFYGVSSLLTLTGHQRENSYFLSAKNRQIKNKAMLCFGKSYEEKQETVIEVEMVMDGEGYLFPW